MYVVSKLVGKFTETPCIRVVRQFQTSVIWKHLYIEAAVQKDFAQKPIFWRVNFKHKIPLEKVKEVLPPQNWKLTIKCPTPFQMSARILQGLHFEWSKLVDNSYLSLRGKICFWAKNYLEKVLEYHFWGKGHFSRAMKGIFLKLQNYVKGQNRGFWGWPT